MKILFVVKRSGIAGVETLLIRMVQNLTAKSGVEAHILLMIRGNEQEFFDMLPSQCKVYCSTSYKDLMQLRTQKIDVIYAFESLGLLWFLLLRSFLKKQEVKINLGVYHPMEYFWEKPIQSFIQRTLAKVVSQIDEKNIVFMNEGILHRYLEYSGKKFQEPQVLPLPIDVSRFANMKREPEFGRFVSVGRLVDFKTYNIHAIEVINRLVTKGYDVSYHVYGTGELESKMQLLIEKYGLQERVHLHGAVPYKELENAFRGAYCFIGCGTALLEASAAGVPCIVGVESLETPETNGFFCDLDGYNVGEFVPGMFLQPYEVFMENILKMPESEYHQFAQKHRLRAAEFNIESYVLNFLTILTNSKNTNIHISRVQIIAWFFAYTLYKILARFGFKNTLTNRYVAHL